MTAKEEAGIPNAGTQVVAAEVADNCGFDDSAPAKKQKIPEGRHTLSKEQKDYYNQWLAPRIPGQERKRSSNEVKAWMVQQLEKWQQSQGVGELELPEGPTWYYDVRIEGIKLNHFDMDSDKNIVRSYLVSYTQHLAAA